MDVHLLQTYPLVRNCTLIKIKYDKDQVNTDVNKIHISWYSTSTDETIACTKHKQNGHAKVRWSACSRQSLIVMCYSNGFKINMWATPDGFKIK